MGTWAGRFAAYINKDVVNPNESKKTAVMTRWLCTVMMLYAIGQMLFMLFSGYYAFVVFPIGFFCIYGGAFRLTYSRNTVAAFYLVILMTLGWNLTSTVLYGWNTGAQYGYGILLVYIFASSYLTLRKKLLYMTGLMAAGSVIFVFGVYGRAVFELSRSQYVLQEFMSMLVTFSTIALTTTVFSGDTLDTVRKLMDYNREITYQAETDALTGLRNRRAGEKYFEKIRKEAIQEGFFVNVVMGDIDFFKKVNDTYGHDAGDEVLKVLAGIFQDFIKDKGAVARWGGEEFLFVMVGMNGDEACFELEKLCERIEKTPIQAGDQELYVTMTFGIEECGREQSMEDALEAADRKLYMGKARGRNQVVM